jgi:hypothetical protein
MPVRQIVELIAYLALLVHRGDKPADFVFDTGTAGAFQRHFRRRLVQQHATARIARSRASITLFGRTWGSLAN